MHTAVAVCNVVLNRRIDSKQFVVCSVLQCVYCIHFIHLECGVNCVPLGLKAVTCMWLAWQLQCNECACEQCSLVGCATTAESHVP